MCNGNMVLLEERIDPFLKCVVFYRKAGDPKKFYIYPFFILISETCQDWGK